MKSRILGVAGADVKPAFRRAPVSLSLLVAGRIVAQGNAIALDQSTPAVQVEATF